MSVVSETRITRCILPEKGAVSFVGGGGKTALLFRYADELRADGYRVVVSTSTHMFRPDHVPVLRDYDAPEVSETLDRGQIVCIGRPAENGKITAPDTDFERIGTCCDYLLIEADGAKGMPLKIPAVHEPVIPSCTAHVIAVMGLDACGKNACSAMSWRMV